MMKKVLTILVVLGLASVASAGLTCYSQDFEGMSQADPAALSSDGWLVYGNVFGLDWNYWYGYGAFPAPNGGCGFCAVAAGQGGPSQGAQQLVVYSDYCNSQHPIAWIEANVYQEMVIGAADVGSTWTFSFDVKHGDLQPPSFAMAFIKTLDPDSGWAMTNFLQFPTDALPTTWGSGSISITIDAGLVGQILQIGFLSTATNYTPSGMLYDNINFAPEPVDVLVDIKPESCPNPLVVKGRGVLTAAILGSCTLDVTDIDAASVELAGAPAIRSEVTDVAGPAAVQLDSMDDIFARPWTDDRDPAEGTGLLKQNVPPDPVNEGTGSMGIDYGVTNDSAGDPHPLSGWDYLGNWVGVGYVGAACDPGGAWGDPAILDYWWTPWGNSYYGKFDRVPTAPFSPLELGILTTGDTFLLDVYKCIAFSPEHVRELQLYDSLGNRNTYSVQAEATATSVGAGWKTYAVCLSNALENNADLSDIADIKLWVSSWSFAPNYPGAPWPEYTGGRPTGTSVKIDDLRLVRAHSPDCGDCLTGADGFDDLVLKFNRADIVTGLGAVHHGDVVDLDLTGNLLTCQPIVGSDCVDIVGKADPAQRPPKK